MINCVEETVAIESCSRAGPHDVWSPNWTMCLKSLVSLGGLAFGWLFLVGTDSRLVL